MAFRLIEASNILDYMDVSGYLGHCWAVLLAEKEGNDFDPELCTCEDCKDYCNKNGIHPF